jgi:excisionase family DNA binding protein
MTDDILTLREVAEYLKLSDKSVYRLVQEKKIPAFKAGGTWRFRRADIDRWIEDQVAADSGEDDDNE